VWIPYAQRRERKPTKPTEIRKTNRNPQNQQKSAKPTEIRKTNRNPQNQQFWPAKNSHNGGCGLPVVSFEV
jgi:hypothetical protein